MNIIVAPGSHSEGFITITFTVTKAMGNIQSGIIAGKLKGVMPREGEKGRERKSNSKVIKRE